jgi:hypothetical protein
LVKIAVGTIICLLIIEAGVRVADAIRNWRAEYVVLPSMVRNFGPPPPWASGLRILEPDDELMWRGRPHAQQKYLDLFCPMRSEEERKGMLSRLQRHLLAGQKVFYVYTNSGTEGRWENIDVPKVRTFTVPAGSGIVYRPIETFGKLYLQADGFLTNSEGYALIAREVRDTLVS